MVKVTWNIWRLFGFFAVALTFMPVVSWLYGGASNRHYLNNRDARSRLWGLLIRRFPP